MSQTPHTHALVWGRLGLPLMSAIAVVLLATASVTAATVWTGPRLVGPAGQCWNVSSAIDSAGRFHVVAECNSGIRYSTSSDSGASWSTATFSHSASEEDLQPQIAVDGATVYVAYSRNIPSTCGFSWAGVSYRMRTLPNGVWSAPRPIGRTGDHLQSLRVVNGTIHATIDNIGKVYYETSKDGAYHRWLLSDATGLTSLRVGSDGRARIAYEAASSLRYSVFTGSGFTRSTIPGTTSRDRSPVLVLDASNHAHLVWAHMAGPGCGQAGGQSADGMYYATNKSGSWSPAGLARRFTKDLGAASLTVDVATGRVHVLLGGEFGVRYYAASASSSWSVQKLTSAKAMSTSLRLDQMRGTLLAVYVREPDSNVSSSVFAFTKP